jgi:hypothetical protein
MGKLTKSEGSGTLGVAFVVSTSVNRNNLSSDGSSHRHGDKSFMTSGRSLPTCTGTHEEVQGNTKTGTDREGHLSNHAYSFRLAFDFVHKQGLAIPHVGIEPNTIY